MNVIKKRTIKNIIYLCFVQLINYLGPLIVMPHLLKTIGVDNVGIINISLSIATLVIVVCSYGYNFTGVEFVARNKEKEISKYLSASFIIRWLWLLLVCLFMVIVGAFNEHASNILLNFVPLFGMVISSLILPVWFFQGLEKLKYIAILNATSKIIFAILIVTFITAESDTTKVLYIYSLSTIGTIFYTLYYLHKNSYLAFNQITIKYLIEHISLGKSIYLQQVLSATVMPLMFLIMATEFSDYDVGLITITDRIVGIPIMLMTVINQSFYTQIIKASQVSKVGYINSVFKIMFAMLSISILFYVFMNMFHAEIINYFFGETNDRIMAITQIMFIGVIFGASGQFFTQVFVTMGFEKYLALITLLTVLITLTCLSSVINEFGVFGGGYFILARQVFVYLICFYLVLFLRYKKNDY